ncbi:MAG TPA: carboxypeptidase regulatory-like domain-containing protein [Kofleriaceae bacterium]|nr:carboxypeptidase regulatory-like domain-containing protein [Kofleriaceae bacterium]
MGHRLLVLALVAMTGTAAAAPGGRVVGKVSVTEANGKATTADVIVYIVGFSEEAPTDRPAAQIAQKGRRFVPDLVAVTVGQSVSFPNQDNFLHNVFSQSTARKFDLGSFKKGDAKEKSFPNPGVVDVYCNIHPEMAATILVLPNKRHTRAGADGSFAIDGVPAGTWTVFAYARRALKPASSRVTVVAGQDATANLALVRGAEPAHVNKFGEKYKDPTTTYR